MAKRLEWYIIAKPYEELSEEELKLIVSYWKETKIPGIRETAMPSLGGRIIFAFILNGKPAAITLAERRGNELYLVIGSSKNIVAKARINPEIMAFYRKHRKTPNQLVFERILEYAEQHRLKLVAEWPNTDAMRSLMRMRRERIIDFEIPPEWKESRKYNNEPIKPRWVEIKPLKHRRR
ncbi:MAG: hypothetical protein J7L14_00180, partial [Candidatus Diapherotrites archaeon]|nr:hypothetical protein [Candidatus Diapherotrites archaeon]